MNSPMQGSSGWASTRDLFAAASINAFYAALGLRTAFEAPEIVGLLAAGIGALLLFALAVQRQERFPTPGAALRAYVARRLDERLPLRYAVGTVVLTVLTLACAVQLGSAREELSLAIVEGMRTGVLILVGLTAWRLNPAGRLTVVAAWIVCDIWVYGAVVVPGIGSGWITAASGTVAGWLLLRAQDWVDALLQGQDEAP